MKTRNNDSTPNETLLNQNITRRSFVKRGAVASAATVFGGNALLGSIPGNNTSLNPYEASVSLGFTVTFEGSTFGHTVANVAAQIVQLLAWGQGGVPAGDNTDGKPVAFTYAEWKSTKYDTRTSEPVNLANPNIWAVDGDNTSMNMNPLGDGTFLLHVSCVDDVITIHVQLKEIKNKPQGGIGN